MTKNIALAILISFPFILDAQEMWKVASESQLQSIKLESREIIPDNYLTFTLNEDVFKNSLIKAPIEFESSQLKTDARISFPMPDGSLKTFIIWKSQVMEPGLSAKYPNIVSYKGYQQDNPNVITRFGIGPNGLHAAIKSEEGMVYIDPYSTSNHFQYITYYTTDHTDESLMGKVICGTPDLIEETQKPKWGLSNRNKAEKIELRVYRLALACTGEWGAVRGTKEKALADMVAFVDRANIVFETELALRAVLIDRNDELIFLDGTTDPYTNPNMGLSILGQNTNILNGRIGGGSYEIGHVFSICYDVGGVAGGNICTPGKGAGVTCHNGSAISNGIVLVFNHEVGHQMTASHTFNRCGSTDQLALGTAYEPGSGSTIMSYAGACGSDNLGAPRDAYYHVASLEQMLSFTNSEASDAYLCAKKIDINNFIPEITLKYSNGFSIPQSTPFFLTGIATDANADQMTYVWEQFDNGTSSPLGEPTGNAPLFRSLRPSKNNTRFYPNVGNLLNGRFSDKQEILPTYGRDLTFRFVVRDNNPMGNAATWEEVKFKVAPNAGPFKITYPILDYTYTIGDAINVTWDVANTDLAPINCKNVDIYMAFDDVLDFEENKMLLLVKSTDNDGLAQVIIPNRISDRARIVIKASNNIFLNVSLFNSKIIAPEKPAFLSEVDDQIKFSCLPENIEFNFTTIGFAGLTDDIKFEVIDGLPTGAVATFSKNSVSPGQNTKLTIDLNGVEGTKNYDIVVRSFVSGIDTIDRILQLKITGTNLANIALLSPENGINGLGPTQIYEWVEKVDATKYQLEVATSPAFKGQNIVISKETVSTSFASNVFLEKATIYYWRVRSSNACKSGEWSKVSAFNTEALSCSVTKTGEISVNISPSGMPIVEAEVVVFNQGEISDVNVKNITGDHQRSGDLVTYLVAPSGKEVLLWSRKCGTSKGFNVGVDDQSNEYFQCPINTARIYRPESPLSAFNGEFMQGSWKLRIEDRSPGEGGKLTGFELELCANIVLNPPVLTRNNILQIHPKDKRDIDRVLLLAEDQNNTPSELVYTLVQAPKKGFLTLNGAPLEAGSQFTQNNIDLFKLKYIHTADDTNDDSFSFTVSDGQGGWVTITDFTIEVNASFPSSTIENKWNDDILIYPNPVMTELNIQKLDSSNPVNQMEILDISGQLLARFSINEMRTTIDMSTYKSGVYLIKFSNGKSNHFKKFIKL